MRVLGIDPGLRKTGWAVIERTGDSSEVKHIACGTITTKHSDSRGDRLLWINSSVSDIIREYSPVEMATEEVFVNVNAESSKKLIMASASSIIASARLGLHISEYLPNEIKKNVTGRGHATKDEVRFFVERILGTDVPCSETHDSIDAIAVALCHCFNLALSDKLVSCGKI
jgi:crossover junction endodeoxyribonuclease RuvC